MEFKNDQMSTRLFLLKTPLSWIVVAADPVVRFAGFLILGSLSIFFTSTVLIFSTLLFLLSKRKLKLTVEPVEEDHIHESVEESSPQMQDGSPDVLSEDVTLDWSDDGSISDEDSLIEISLPGGHYIKHKEDHPNTKYCPNPMQQTFPDLLPETIFHQRSLMDILSEFNDMNEGDNLIEIDI